MKLRDACATAHTSGLTAGSWEKEIGKNPVMAFTRTKKVSIQPVYYYQQQ